MQGTLRVRPKRVEILALDIFTKNGSSNLYIVHITQI